ncbi:RNA processing protein [Bonamia ostreae]|uniref:U6 snRNA-associated Sm-like protein LSm4 n=1 Tax=Bonamia ostreae TaxID=126728 RepID=A0ABV2ANJ4_9EUKA
MILPLALLNAAKETDAMIELKNGNTYNGRLTKIDHFMNVVLGTAICTFKGGSEFLQLKECYIRGNSIRSIQIESSLLEKAAAISGRKRMRRFRGRGRGRGRGKTTNKRFAKTD